MRMAVAAGAASVASAAAVVALSPRAEAGGAAGLRPDLVTLSLQQEDVIITAEGGRRYLRLSTEIANHGVGPLEVFPSPESTDCDGDGNPLNDRDASQRTFADTDGDGGYTAGVDGVQTERLFGCMRYHAIHNHWHVLDFARYELRREPDGHLAAKRRKVGFCVGDNRIAFPGAPHLPPDPTYPFGPPGSVGCNESATQGLSVGWADLYLFYVPGQELDVTGLKPGRFCLISRADPRDLIDESNEHNNVRRTLLTLEPRQLAAARLPGKCRG
jgi:hypothetical protein